MLLEMNEIVDKWSEWEPESPIQQYLYDAVNKI